MARKIRITTTPQPEIRVQFFKRPDGSVTLRCIRRDGSSTWQHHEKHVGFFAFHDLHHFAVETVFGFRSGFYGLIADGWDIADTTGKGQRGKLSADSVFVEYVVGLLERETSGGAAVLTATQFNEQIDAMAGVDPSRSRFTDVQLAEARSRIEELEKKWGGVSVGSTMELSFSRS